MNCANHPEASAVAFCRECGTPMCPECQRTALGSIYCERHLPAATVPPPIPETPINDIPRPSASYTSSPYAAPMPGATPVADPGVHPLLAFVLGFAPGVGAIYNGQYAKGLIHAVIFGLLVSIVSSGHAPGTEAFLGVMIAAWVIYQAFEAYHTARKRRYGVAVEEFSSLFEIRPAHGRFPIGAIALIGLGCLLLLDTTEIVSMEQIERYWPALLIAFGFYMLYSRITGAQHHSTSVNEEAQR